MVMFVLCVGKFYIYRVKRIFWESRSIVQNDIHQNDGEVGGILALRLQRKVSGFCFKSLKVSVLEAWLCLNDDIKRIGVFSLRVGRGWYH